DATGRQQAGGHDRADGAGDDPPGATLRRGRLDREDGGVRGGGIENGGVVGGGMVDHWSAPCGEGNVVSVSGQHGRGRARAPWVAPPTDAPNRDRAHGANRLAILLAWTTSSERNIRRVL